MSIEQVVRQVHDLSWQPTTLTGQNISDRVGTNGRWDVVEIGEK